MPTTPTVNCSCPFLTPFLIGVGVAVLGAYALDKALPTEAELARMEAERRYKKDSLALAKGARASVRPNGVGGMRLADRLVAAGY